MRFVPRAIAAAAACTLLAACGGGGSSGSAAPAEVTVNGAVTFDLVPAVPGAGLDYAATQRAPARGVTVELAGEDAVLATAATDEQGRYSVAVAPGTRARLRVRAEMVRMGEPSWSFRVVDNTQGSALYVLEGEPFEARGTAMVRDLHAPSGWGGTAYTDTRAAAPFAILDAVRDAVEWLLTVEPQAQFPPLQIHWSPLNAPLLGADGAPDPLTGEIGSSLHVPGLGIFLLGAEDDDTDEYDRHVIVHEWAHYYETAFARSDSIGGPHARGDLLDPRVALSEGWANAYAALATGERVLVDTQGPRQAFGFSLDVAGAGPQSPNPNPGWFSEESVQQIFYHLAAGEVGLGFAPIHAVLVEEMRGTAALTTIFAFVDALKAARPDAAADIDALVASRQIDTVIDAYGTGESNAGNPGGPDVLPVYTDLAVGQPAVNVCSTDLHSSPVTGSVNKLGSRRFLKLTLDAFDSYAFSATATSMPAGARADPDLVLHAGGVVAVSQGGSGPQCQPGGPPAECLERFTRALGPGNYVLEVYEWTNTNSHDDEAENRPIGRTCFDVQVIRQ